MKPMLAGSIDPSRLSSYASSDEWVFEQKVDGHRLLTTIDQGTVRFLNRAGDEKTTLPNAHQLRPQFERMKTGTWCFDGEIVDGTYWLFDLPYAGGQVTVQSPFEFRREVLERFFDGWQPASCVKLLPCWREADEKLLCAAEMQNTGREGVMLKHRTGTYQPGKRSKHVLKAKFTKTVDCVVLDVNIDGKDNAEIGLVYDDGSTRSVGRCSTIGKPKVTPGDVVELKYLYVNNPAAPRLYQPTILCLRDDKRAHECTVEQLIFTDKGIMT